MPKDKIQIRLFCPFLLSLRVIKYSLLHVNLHFKESGTDFLNFLVNTFFGVSLYRLRRGGYWADVWSGIVTTDL